MGLLSRLFKRRQSQNNSSLKLRSERTVTLLQIIQDKWYEHPERHPMKEVNRRLFGEAREWERLAMTSIIYLSCIAIVTEKVRSNPRLGVENCINLLEGAPFMADHVDVLRSLLRTNSDTELISRIGDLVTGWDVEGRKAAEFAEIIKKDAPEL